MTATLSCPSCGAALASRTAGALRCARCAWRLIALDEWRKLSPDSQGYFLYMQGAWPTSELAGEKNPYPRDSDEWHAFRRGEQRAVQDAQDGEE